MKRDQLEELGFVVKMERTCGRVKELTLFDQKEG